MKIKSLILCFMVFVTGSIVAQENDLFIKKDGSIEVKITVHKDSNGLYVIPQHMEIKSIKREEGFKNKESVEVSYNIDEKKTILGELKIASSNPFENAIIIAPDTITYLSWGTETYNLKPQQQASREDELTGITTCKLILKKDTIILNSDTLLFSDGVFRNNSKNTIVIDSMKLEPAYDKNYDAVVTQLGKPDVQLYNGKGRSLFAPKSKLLFSIQPGTKINISWGDLNWLIDSTTQPSIEDWMVENWYWLIITAFLVCLVVFRWRKYCKQKHNIKDLLDKSNEIKATISSNGKLVELIGTENKDGQKTLDLASQTSSQSKCDVVQVSENLGFISKLILNIESLDYFNCANSDSLEKICADRPKIKEVLGIGETDKIDYNTIDDILNALDKTLSKKSRSLNDIIDEPTEDEKSGLKKYIKKWLNSEGNENRSDSDDDIRKQLLWLESDKDKKEIDTIVLNKIGGLIGKNYSTIDDLVAEWNNGKNSTQQDELKDKDINVQQLLLENLQEITGSRAKKTDEILDEINTIIGVYNKLKFLIDKYHKNTPNELEEAIESSIMKRISDCIVLDKECEKYDSLKNLILLIKDSDNVDKLVKALPWRLSGIYLELNTLNTDKSQACKAKTDTETMVISKVKGQFEDLFKDKLNADTPLSAINNFVIEVKRLVKEKDAKITGLMTEVLVKEEGLKQAQGNLLTKEEALKHIYQSYASFIVSTFEQIEKSVQLSCNAGDKSAALVKKINERIIANDSWGLSDFVKEMKKITDTDLNIDEMNEKIKSLFTRCLRFSSWIDILAQIYIYIQEPTLAGKLTALGLDTVKVNQAFVLTETMMSIVGIKLQYPKLFTDTFDEKCFEKESLSEIQDLVEDFRDLVDIRPGLIIDLIRVGYSFDETKKKAIVVIDM